MNRTDMIIDFESFGQDATKCAPIDMSVIVYNQRDFLNNPFTFESALKNVKTFKFDVKELKEKFGCVIEQNTIDFWKSQPKEVRQRIKPSENDLSVSEFASQFIKYLKSQPKIEHWWSRSNAFDPIILWRLMDYAEKKHFMSEYLLFWRMNDIRTFIRAKLDFPKINSFIPIKDETYWRNTHMSHMSNHDVTADLLRLQAIARIENDMDMLER